MLFALHDRITLFEMVNQVKEQGIQVGGSHISYLESGPLDGPVVILLHGIPASAELWRGVMQKLSQQGWRCYAPDLPGYGRTTVTANGDYSIKGAAALLSKWIEQEDLRDIWLIGHDTGGGVAQLVLTENTPRFAKLTLTNCVTSDSWPVPEVHLLIRAAKWRIFGLLAAIGMFKGYVGRALLHRSLVDKNFARQNTVSRIFWDSKVSTPEGRRKFRRMLAQLDTRHTMENMSALTRISVPVELIWGMQDPNQPWSGPGETLKKVFPMAIVKKLPNAGHFPQIDSEQEYLDALLSEN